MTKTLRKTIMIRFRLKNRFHKARSDEIGYSLKQKEVYA